jgi:hypothetical protein
MTAQHKESPSRKTASAEITATLTFTSTGYLLAILLNAQSNGDEAVLERALDRLLKPDHIDWVRRLFRHG